MGDVDKKHTGENLNETKSIFHDANNRQRQRECIMRENMSAGPSAEGIQQPNHGRSNNKDEHGIVQDPGTPNADLKSNLDNTNENSNGAYDFKSNIQDKPAGVKKIGCSSTSELRTQLKEIPNHDADSLCTSFVSATLKGGTSNIFQSSEFEIITQAEDTNFVDTAMQLEETSVQERNGNAHDHPSTEFDPAGGLNVQRLLLELVEEVRIRRVRDTENEERIKQLVRENQEMENKYEDVRSNLMNLHQNFSDKVAQVKREKNTELNNLGEVKAKLGSICEANEKEMKALKCEVRSLQLSKYTLQRKIREQESKFASTNSENGNHLAQITQLGKKCDSFAERASQVEDNVTKLERNVEEAVRINRKLTYVNRHQLCEIKDCKKQVERLNHQLNNASVECANRPLETNQQIHQMRNEIISLEDQATVEIERRKNTEMMLKDAMQDYKMASMRLKEAHQLLSQHIVLENTTREELKDSQHKLSNQMTECLHLNTKYEELAKKSREEHLGNEEKREALSTKIYDMEAQFTNLTQEYGKVKNALSELEDLNTDWARRNMELNETIEGLKRQLDKPTSNIEVQTDSEMAVEVEVCTQVVEAAAQTLTSCFSSTHCTTQTDEIVNSSLNTTTCSKSELHQDKSIQVNMENVHLVIDDSQGLNSKLDTGTCIAESGGNIEDIASTCTGRGRLRSLRKRETLNQVPLMEETPVCVPGISNVPNPSGSKRAKKVRFSEEVHAQAAPDNANTIVIIDEYDSDNLFSEEDDDIVATRQLLQHPSQSKTE